MRKTKQQTIDELQSKLDSGMAFIQQLKEAIPERKGFEHSNFKTRKMHVLLSTIERKFS